MPIDAPVLDDLAGLVDDNGPPAAPASGSAPTAAPPSAPMAAPPPAAPTVRAIAATPARHPGVDWQALLKVLAPMLGELGGGGGHGHFLTGYLHGQELANEEQRQKTQDAQHLAAQKADYVLKIAEHAEGLSDPVDFQNLVHLAQHAGEKAGYLQPDELTAQLTFSPTKQAQAQLKKLDEQLALIERKTGMTDQQLIDAKASMKLPDGRILPVEAYLSFRGALPVDRSGKPIPLPKPSDLTQKTEEERFIAKWARDKGTTPDKLTSDQDLEARRVFREAGRGEPRDLVSQQFDDLISLWKRGHPGQELPLEVRTQLRERAKRQMAEAGSTSLIVNAGQQGDVDVLARSLKEGDLVPSMLSRRSASYNTTLAKANKLSLEEDGKPLNFAKLETDYRAAQRFVGSMNSSQMIRFRGLADSVVNTIDEVRRLGDELQQGGVQRWNRAKRGTILQVYGNTPQSQAAADYVAAVSTLKEEFASLVQGGYSPTEPAFALANTQVNGDYGVKDLNASLSEVQRLIKYRTHALDTQTPRGLEGPPAATPPAVEQWVRDPKTKALVKKGTP